MARYHRYRRRRDARFAASAMLAGAVLAAIATHSNAPAATGAAGAGGAAQTSASTSANVALGQHMAAGDGWGTGAQWSCLDALWTRESGWSSTAANPVSDARGIAQDINGWSASYSYGNAAQQIAWGLAYISGRYGTPCAAWNHETSAGWY